jgi:hypothetical protein
MDMRAGLPARLQTGPGPESRLATVVCPDPSNQEDFTPVGRKGHTRPGTQTGRCPGPHNEMGPQAKWCPQARAHQRPIRGGSKSSVTVSCVMSGRRQWSKGSCAARTHRRPGTVPNGSGERSGVRGPRRAWKGGVGTETVESPARAPGGDTTEPSHPVGDEGAGGPHQAGTRIVEGLGRVSNTWQSSIQFGLNRVL